MRRGLVTLQIEVPIDLDIEEMKELACEYLDAVISQNNIMDIISIEELPDTHVFHSCSDAEFIDELNEYFNYDEILEEQE